MLQYKVYQEISEGQNGLKNLFISMGIVSVVMAFLTLNSVKSLEAPLSEGPPDSWWGWKATSERTSQQPEQTYDQFKPHVLYDYYEKIGEEGRKWRFAMTAWDIFPFMFVYTTLFGALLVRGLTKIGINDGLIARTVTLLPVLVLFYDAVENVICLYQGYIFPEEIDAKLIHAGGTCGKLKFSFLAAVIIIITFLELLSRSVAKDKTKDD
mmetsp:Transcript_3549/g.4457  ORF Transcript_3549/g.4457 Transcript_3549/m.4457 type:complete len:210 (-) Transcript_3549:149-778(-)